MAFLRAHSLKFTALLQQLLPPLRQFVRAIRGDGTTPPMRGLLSCLIGPGAVIDPTGYAPDKPPILDRPERPRQMSMLSERLAFQA
jgi:hypothetical protein